MAFIICNQMGKRKEDRYGWIIPSQTRGHSLNIQKACHFPKIVWYWPFSQFVRKLLHNLRGLSVILQQRLHKRWQLTYLLHLHRRKHKEYFRKKLNTIISFLVTCIVLFSSAAFLYHHDRNDNGFKLRKGFIDGMKSKDHTKQARRVSPDCKTRWEKKTKACPTVVNPDYVLHVSS